MTKLLIDPIEGVKVRLRLLTQDDLPLTLSWRNQDEVRKWFFHSDIIDLSQHLKWFENYMMKDNDFVFIIEDRENFNNPVGQVSIYHVDWQQRSCEFGRLMIGELAARGRGLAKEATLLALQVAFIELKMKKVYLEVYKNNNRAIELYRSCGFYETGQFNDILYFEKTI